jgi:hypothetical protein
MRCGFCGHEQASGKFCDRCGRQIVAALRRTEKEDPQAQALRCGECGVPTTEPVCPGCGVPVRPRSFL